MCSPEAGLLWFFMKLTFLLYSIFNFDNAAATSTKEVGMILSMALCFMHHWLDADSVDRIFALRTLF